MEISTIVGEVKYIQLVEKSADLLVNFSFIFSTLEFTDGSEIIK